MYWLGSWQFACLDYYRPPNGVANRCVEAEPYPPVLARLVARIETLARGLYRGAALPERWHLSTCLVNLYGSRLESGRRVDCARVGETRRVNLTFRYVPDEHVVPFALLPPAARGDVHGYVAKFARESAFFARALTAEAKPPGAELA